MSNAVGLDRIGIGTASLPLVRPPAFIIPTTTTTYVEDAAVQNGRGINGGK